MPELLLRAEGDAFRNGRYDLRSIDTIISNYRQVIDKSVPILLGHRTLSPEMKSRVLYEAEIRSGSLDILLNLVIEHKEDVAGLLFVDGGNNLTMLLAKLICNVIDFRRKLTDVLENLQKPKVVINNNFGISVNNNSGNINISHPNIMLAADSTKPSLDRLIYGIDGKRIEDIQIKYDKEKAIITPEDVRITGSQKEELPSYIEIVGRLDMVAFSAKRGTILSGNGRYQVTWDDDLRHKIHQCADKNGILFKARPIIDNRRIKDNTVGFHLIDCIEQQLPIFDSQS